MDSVNNSVFVNEEEEESNTEFISIKKSWLRNIAAACIALIAFFTYSSPLGTPTVQKSQIDTGMLNRIMPKEINKVAQPQELVLSTESQAEESILPSLSTWLRTTNCKQPLLTTASFWQVVLPSAMLPAMLNSSKTKDSKEARVLITDNNVKVIYGTYSTEGEAYTASTVYTTMMLLLTAGLRKVKE